MMLKVGANPEVMKEAEKIGKKIQREDGVGNALIVIEKIIKAA